MNSNNAERVKIIVFIHCYIGSDLLHNRLEALTIREIDEGHVVVTLLARLVPGIENRTMFCITRICGAGRSRESKSNPMTRQAPPQLVVIVPLS